MPLFLAPAPTPVVVQPPIEHVKAPVIESRILLVYESRGKFCWLMREET